MPRAGGFSLFASLLMCAACTHRKHTLHHAKGIESNMPRLGTAHCSPGCSYVLPVPTKDRRVKNMVSHGLQQAQAAPMPDLFRVHPCQDVAMPEYRAIVMTLPTVPKTP